MKKIIAAVAATLLLAGCGPLSLSQPEPTPTPTPTPTPETFNAQVFITFDPGSGVEPGYAQACRVDSSSGYNDLMPGSRVIITDNAGTTVAISEVGSTIVADTYNGWATSCRAMIIFPEVPVDVPSYRLVVGQRPPYDTTRAELEEGLQLSIG